MSQSGEPDRNQKQTHSFYERLDSPRKEIRLLRILPDTSARALSKSSGAIHCVLSHAFLEESPRYHALSYPWQDSKLNGSFDDPEADDSKLTIDGFILLNNQHVPVTPSLWVALWHFRLIAQRHAENQNAHDLKFGDLQRLGETEEWLIQLHTALWVDALCINQSDIEERSHQVSMMGDIYKNAECVHAWLGLSTNTTADAMWLLKGLTVAIDPTKIEGLAEVDGDELGVDEDDSSVDTDELSAGEEMFGPISHSGGIDKLEDNRLGIQQLGEKEIEVGGSEMDAITCEAPGNNDSENKNFKTTGSCVRGSEVRLLSDKESEDEAAEEETAEEETSEEETSEEETSEEETAEDETSEEETSEEETPEDEAAEEETAEDETSEGEAAEDETSEDEAAEEEVSVAGAVRTLMKLYIEDNENRERWVALFDIYNRPYWKRLWIVQEYLLGKRTLIHVGLCVIDALVFAKIRNEVQFYCMSNPLSKAIAVSMSNGRATNGPINSFVISLKKLGYTESDHQPSELLDLLRGHRLQVYSQPRDIIYALLGLCDAITQKSIPVDYSIELGELFKITAWYIIESSKSLDILKENDGKSSCYCCKDQDQLLNLPSWVPDWRCRKVVRSFEGTFISALSWPRGRRTEASLRREVLSCRGLLLGSIDVVLSPAPDDETNPFVMSKAVFNFATDVLDGLNLSRESENLRKVLKMAYRSLISEAQPTYGKYITAKEFITLVMVSSDDVRLLDYVVNVSKKRKRAIDVLGQCLRGLCLFTCTMVPPPSPKQENVLDALVLGVCDPSFIKGDTIAILYGCTAVIALRADVHAPEHFKVLGLVYLPSYSTGRVHGDFEERDFELS
jgi:hypothetical protein